MCDRWCWTEEGNSPLRCGRDVQDLLRYGGGDPDAQRVRGEGSLGSGSSRRVAIWALEARTVGYGQLDKEGVHNGKSRRAAPGRFKKRTLWTRCLGRRAQAGPGRHRTQLETAKLNYKNVRGLPAGHVSAIPIWFYLYNKLIL